MKNLFSKISLVLMGLALSIASVSCNNNKSYEDLTPAQQQTEYVKFQKDSIKSCTENVRMAEASVRGAFDRIPENNGYYKIDKVNCTYDPELKCWVGVMTYHVDRNNTYYQSQATFHVRFTMENNGFAKDAKLYYTVVQVPNKND